MLVKLTKSELDKLDYYGLDDLWAFVEDENDKGLDKFWISKKSFEKYLEYKDKETEKRLRELYSNFNKRANISVDRASESIFIYCRDQIKSKFPEFFKDR